MQSNCLTCHYRNICVKGITEENPPCKYYRDERAFGVFKPLSSGSM